MAEDDLAEVPYEHGALEARFLKAVEAFSEGRTEAAELGFREVLMGDPRLPEPRLELAVVLFQKGQSEEAEAQARMALDQVQKGWCWLENFSPEALEAHASNLLGEVLLHRLAEGELADLPGDELVGKWKEAEGLFKRAVSLDPDNGQALANIAGFKAQRRKSR